MLSTNSDLCWNVFASIRSLGLLFCVVLLGGVPSAFAQQEYSAELQQSIDLAVERVRPALVRIHVVQYQLSGGREVKYEASGSGVIITPEGHVVTNHHVAGNTRRISCTLADKREIEAELVGSDPLSDIAVIKLRGKPGESFPTARFGDSSQLKVGQRVLAMGSPMALSQSVTMGIISNLEMVMPRFYSEMFTIEGEEVGTLVRWIAHDAEIYGGNSGGPLVNLQGDIVGINEIRFGLGGAIPGNLAREVAEELIQRSEVQRAWLGLEVQPLLKSLDIQRGVLVSGTLKDTPAEKAGFLPGDILLSLDGRQVSARFQEEIPLFNQVVMDLEVGKKVKAVVLRDGKEKTLEVTPTYREKARLEGQEIPEWGITARNISLMAAKELKRENQEGVLVTSVRPGGPAGEAKPDLKQKDVITEVDGTRIKNLEALLTLTAEKLQGKENELVPVKVGFERRDERYLTVVKIGLKEWQDPGLEVRKAWVPISYQVLTRDMAESLGLSGRKGIRVTRVYPDSAAQKAGLEVGDILVKFDGEEIPASQPEDIEVFAALVRQYKIGARVPIEVLRQGEPKVLEIELAASPQLAREMRQYNDAVFDFSARDIAFLDRMRENLPADQQGVMVSSVGQGGWAALGQLAVDDLIVTVDGQPVENVQVLEKQMQKVAEERRSHVVLQVKRGIHTLFLEIEPRWESLRK